MAEHGLAGRDQWMSVLQRILLPIASLPRFPVDMFYTSLGASFALVMGAIWLSPPGVSGWVISRSPVVDRVTASWLLDPLLANVSVACVAASMLFVSRPSRWRGSMAWCAAFRSLLPFVVLGLVLLLGDLVLKPAFNYPRPPDPLPEPPITRLAEGIIPFLSKSPGDSAPSGFVMRQVAMLYLVLWVGWGSEHRRGTRAVTTAFASCALVAVAFCRTYRSAHSVFDVVLALAVGTLLFWTIMAIPLSLVRVKWMEFKHLFCALGIAYFAFGVRLIALSQNAALFLRVFAGGVIVAFLALISPGIGLPRQTGVDK